MLFENKTKRLFKKVSVTGRMAFGIKCLEQFIIEKEIQNAMLYRLLEVLWEFTITENLAEWDSKITELAPESILDNHLQNSPENYKHLTASEFQHLKDFYLKADEKLIDLIGYVIDIGTTHLYGATGQYAKEALESTMKVYQFAKKEIVVIPDLNKFTFTEFSERNGWGNRTEKKQFD